MPGVRKADWKTCEGTAKAMPDDRALETIPVMAYVWERTNKVPAKEEMLRGHE